MLGACTDNMRSVISFVKHHLISQKKKGENAVTKYWHFGMKYSPTDGGNKDRQNEAENTLGQKGNDRNVAEQMKRTAYRRLVSTNRDVKGGTYLRSTIGILHR